MRQPKEFIPGQLVFVTFRTQEGLPFVTLEFMNMLIESAIARAQRLYPVTLCQYEFEPNHAHLMIRVTDPELVPRFVGFVKGECAHYLNGLLGRKQHSVWVERYDSPTVLDLSKALEKFAYGLLNPVKDCLVNAMADYPGVSSYQLLKERKEFKRVKDIPRNGVLRLKDPTRPYLENDKLVRHFHSDRFKEIQIAVDPTALRLCFEESQGYSKEQFYQTLEEYVDVAEVKYQKDRGDAPVLGVERLRRASILAPHTPPQGGRKTICLASNKDDRIRFIQRFKAVCRQCREVLTRWRQGYINEPFPPGMFPPSLPRMANMLPALAL